MKKSRLISWILLAVLVVVMLWTYIATGGMRLLPFDLGDNPLWRVIVLILAFLILLAIIVWNSLVLIKSKKFNPAVRYSIIGIMILLFIFMLWNAWPLFLR